MKFSADANCVRGLLRTCGSKTCAHEHPVSVVRFGSDGQVKIGFVSVVSPGVLCMILNHLFSGLGCVHRVSGSFWWKNTDAPVMSCKCRLHVETRWSPTRTWHAVLRRSSKDTTIAIVPSFPDTPRAFTASFNVIPRFFKPGRCGLRFFEFSDVEQRFVGSCAAHVRLEPRWQCLKPPSRCELGCMWHKVQLGRKRGAVLSRTSWSRTVNATYPKRTSIKSARCRIAAKKTCRDSDVSSQCGSIML